MEYTRRRRKRGRAHRGGGAGRVIAALLVAGAIIYLISASQAGTWIAENVMAPLFSTFQGNSGEEADATPVPSLSLVTNDTQTDPQETENIELPAMACFALQMGAYSSMDNANTQAKDLQKQGAGGFVLQDGDKYRVLAAAYEDEDSLKQVQEQLKAEGRDCAAYLMSTPSNVLKVTASESKLQSIKRAFSSLAELQKKLAAAVIAFDKEKQTPEEGRRIVKTMSEELEAVYRVFAADITPGESTILDAVKDCFANTIQILQNLANNTTENTVDFSSDMKYTHLYVLNAYHELGQKVSAA